MTSVNNCYSTIQQKLVTAFSASVVTKYRKGKKISSVKKPIHYSHIMLIQSRKFIPGLFSDCACGKKNKTRKNK
jgi:hypothetical protein